MKKEEKIVSEFFDKMRIKIKAKTNISEESISLDIVPEDESISSLLIGYQGENLLAFQQILGLLFYRKLKSTQKVLLDISGYRAKRQGYLESLAHKLAAKVKISRRFEILRPMNAFERRVVHMALSEVPGIITESVGEEPYRRVMIKVENSN
jgi:spoIIIJ-associated protein